MASALRVENWQQNQQQSGNSRLKLATFRWCHATRLRLTTARRERKNPDIALKLGV
jgi:hypothetical protein